MWDKKMIEEMFPSGVLPMGGSTEELLYGDFERVVSRELKMARNMSHQHIETIWNSDGDVIRNIIYDVYPFPAVDGVHVLGVYGGKMLQNWLQLPRYHNNVFCPCATEAAEEEDTQNVGFNYTGLQE